MKYQTCLIFCQPTTASQETTTDPYLLCKHSSRSLTDKTASVKHPISINDALNIRVYGELYCQTDGMQYLSSQIVCLFWLKTLCMPKVTFNNIFILE